MKPAGRKLMVGAAVLGAGWAPRLAHACAMCGLPFGDHMTHAFNSSVLFMLTAPYAVFVVGGVVALFAYRSARRRQAQRRQASPGPGLALE